jgi:thiol-disulfide isomerase/thioredoxin
MHRQNVITAGLVLVAVFVLVVAVAGVPGEAKHLGALGMAGSGATAGSNIPSIDSDSLVTAPEFAGGVWINSDPLTLKSLRGRVVLVEFWTFGCYYCRKTLPALKRWDDGYREKGLTIIGVHSPEHDREKDIDKLRSKVSSFGLRYPVVTDNDHETFRAYDVKGWPTLFVLDKQGRVRLTRVGKGAYDKTEQMINKLLAEDEKAADQPKAEKAAMIVHRRK